MNRNNELTSAKGLQLEKKGGANNSSLKIGFLMASGAAGALGYFIISRYHVCSPHQFLVRTGLGIQSMRVSKQGLQFPFQEVTYISMVPKTFQFDLHNMSKEKVEFNLPVVFTVAPVHPNFNLDKFSTYATRLHALSEHDLEETIRGMIEGETRTLTANMSIEEMFSGKEKFKEIVVDKIEEDLLKMGLEVLNANIREMTDYDEHNNYFEYRKKRAIQTANYEAQRDVAAAEKDGKSAVAMYESETRINVAKANAEAKISENERDIIIAESRANLAEAEAEALKRSDVASVNASMAAKQREIQLQIEVDKSRYLQQMEAQRANTLAAVNAEAEGIERIASADLVKDMKRAEGIMAIYKSQAEGVQHIFEACGRDSKLTQFYLGLEKNLYPELGDKMADAMQGLNPKINIWNTGNSSNDDDNDPMLKIVKMTQGLAPLLDGIFNQTSLVEGINKIKSSALSNMTNETTRGDSVNDEVKEGKDKMGSDESSEIGKVRKD